VNEDHKAWLQRVQNLLDGFDMLDTNENDKIQIATALQMKISWIRWRAGMDKECFSCRKPNEPHALVCVHCNLTMCCQACFDHSRGKVWYCPHGSSFRLHEIAKMNRHREEESKAEPEEPTPPPMPRFRLGD
jgi:hypothetical protein